ncbi:MAG: hypothetical protein PWQ37_1391 [Candidatus Petromonas sp.]|jgi:uncharacterized protein YabE (DUF348 family)|nr:hypothetical protein [Candidatus Petromonas sp.]
MKQFFKLQKIFKDKRMILVIVILLLLGALSIETVFSKEIRIRDRGKEITITTISFSVDSALEKAGVKLEKYDRLNIDKDAPLEDGMVIEVKRAFPVTINVDGEKLNVSTVNNRVKDILDQYNIKLNEKDRTEPKLDEEIAANGTINVIRVREEITKEEIEIPYKAVIKFNDEMAADKVKKVKEGEKGKKEVEYKVVYENNVEVSREVLKETILKKPVDEVVEKGAENYLVASRGKVVRYKKALIMSSTAYDLSYESCGKTPDHPEYGITYSGTRVRPGVVAVDPKVIPLGSKLYIESLDGTKDYGFASAEDTGSAIKGNKIDLYMENRKDALRYGRRKVKVYILE